MNQPNQQQQATLTVQESAQEALISELIHQRNTAHARGMQIAAELGAMKNMLNGAREQIKNLTEVIKQSQAEQASQKLPANGSHPLPVIDAAIVPFSRTKKD